MTREQLLVILGKASLRCPNLAPNFKEQPMIFEEYFEELENVDYELALNNMKAHSRESDYFPSIAVLCRSPQRSFYDDHKRLTERHMLQLEEAKKNAIPMPREMFKEWLGDA